MPSVVNAAVAGAAEKLDDKDDTVPKIDAFLQNRCRTSKKQAGANTGIPPLLLQRRSRSGTQTPQEGAKRSWK